MSEASVHPATRTLEGKTVVVTGASRGLGRAMARATALAGAAVVVTGRDLAALDETVQLIGADGVGTALPYALDVTDAPAVESTAAAIWEATGGVDVVFANAGISLTKPARETSIDEFDRILKTNVNGTFSTLRAFGSRMLNQGHGKLVTVASDIGIRGSEGWVAYSASKGAVIAMTKTLAWEWAPTLTVNSIAPGAFATDINSHLLSLPEVMTAIESTTPLGRVGRSDEIGPLTVFLASAGSDFMTGQIISIDGGIQRS
ncbi:SDR family NAD(P)-dependent oxidoreductase [Microbacterium sp. NPDC055910]|uniref:SDR family NAD(P)-dependent oxidoreductase n=1 Tax=Microbacterium sp. NPDC055910 TaxID=3345659 RepID=UPI0035E11698